ncbi:MAG: hypothetical protein JXA92_08530 [candidate division Zixibacteria bacterium]|nr:hypothetical protein [candidate division Zixibacteria bacterium]
MNHFDIYKAQSKAWSILSRSYKNKRVASTYIFHGREGLGQWPLALSFAALLNCESPKETDDDRHPFYPCGQCRNCRNIFSLNFEGLNIIVPIGPHKKHSEAIDLTNEFLEIKRAEPLARQSSAKPLSIPIDMAREVKKSLSRLSTEGITRVVLFYRMEKMLASSADALLKLIEEPPSDTVIILTAERPEALLPTVQSRAQLIRMERVPVEVMVDYLQNNYDLDAKKAQLLARISEGLPGFALDMTAGFEDEESSSRTVGFLLFKSLLIDSGPKVVSLLTEMVNDRDHSEAEELLRLWQSLIRDSAYFAVTDDSDGLVNVDFVPELKKLSRFFNNAKVAETMTADIKNTLADFRVNVHIQAALVALVLQLKKRLKSGPA